MITAHTIRGVPVETKRPRPTPNRRAATLAAVEKHFRSLEQPTILSRRELPLSALIKDEVIRVEPWLATRLLTEGYCDLQENRHKKPAARVSISMFAAMMRSGEYRATSSVYVCLIDGQIVLVDGYHRLSAVVEADMPVDVRFSVIPCASMEDVHLAYATFNRNTRARTNAQVRNAYQIFDDNTPVSKSLQNSFYRTIPVLLAGFRNSGGKSLPPECRTDAFVFSQGPDWVPACEQYQSVLDARPSRALNAKFLAPSVVGVALVTFRYAPEEATRFWHGVFNRTGLDPRDPRVVLYESLLNRQDRAVRTVRGIAAMVAKAWERYLKGEGCDILRVRDIDAGESLRIHGLPYRAITE